MKLVEMDWTPTDRQLRQFGVICLVALPLVGWIWGAASLVVAVLAGVGLLLATAGMIAPRLLKPVFLALAIVATPIGMALGEVAMLLIYFGVFVPIGLVFRITKRDALQMKIDRDAKTYWQASKRPRNVTSYYHQS